VMVVVFSGVSCGVIPMFWSLVGCMLSHERTGIMLVEVSRMMIPKMISFFNRFPLIFFPRTSLR
jgi:hypothetical protein